MTPRRRFTKAVKKGDLETVKELLDTKKINPAGYGNSAITEASRYGHANVVKLILEDDRVDQTAHSFYSIRMAIQYKHIEVIKLLLEDENIDFSNCNLRTINWNTGLGVQMDILLIIGKNKTLRIALKECKPDIYEILVIEETKNKVNDF